MVTLLAKHIQLDMIKNSEHLHQDSCREAGFSICNLEIYNVSKRVGPLYSSEHKLLERRLSRMVRAARLWCRQSP